MPPLPRISIIAALDERGVIGRNNRLPWHLPADLAHFRRLTLGHSLIMGRRTWESLPGLLPERKHIVLSRNPDYRAEGAVVIPSPQAALERVRGEEEVFVIGGAQVFQTLLPRADRLYLSFVGTRIADGDAFFPPFQPEDWRLIHREERPKDKKNPFPLIFVTLDRR